MTIVIDHGIAENPIEPGNHLLIRHLRSAFQSAHKCRLEDIFGGSSRFDASFEKRKKLPMSVNQQGNRFR